MRKWIAITALAATVAVGSAVATADNQSVNDRTRESKGLKQNPELDIVRSRAGHAVGARLKHSVVMRGKLKPAKKNSRPFILINTRGGKRSDFEYLVVGPRVFKVRPNGEYRKVGANRFNARKKTWVYRFKAKTIGSPKSYGWAALTAKGKTIDLSPGRRYQSHQTRP